MGIKSSLSHYKGVFNLDLLIFYKKSPTELAAKPVFEYLQQRKKKGQMNGRILGMK